MVSGGGLAEGREIHLGVLVFVTDDSAWLQEAPLDVEALPVRGRRTFMRASAASFTGSRRPSIGRLQWCPRSPLFADASGPVDRGFSGR